MMERDIEKKIHAAVEESLSGLDHLPSQENEILEKVRGKKVVNILYPESIRQSKGQLWQKTETEGRPVSLRTVLAALMVLIVLAGVLIARNFNSWNRQIDSISVNTTAPMASLDSVFAGTNDQTTKKAQTSLDRIDLNIDSELLWDEETGILAEGPQIDKSQIPFRNAVYRKMSNQSFEGEMIYSSAATGEVLLNCAVYLKLGEVDVISSDMPQKSLLLKSTESGFEVPLFDDRQYTSYASVLLRNGGKDSPYTRVADGVQTRLIERKTDMNILTLAWKPVVVYLNGEYWGQYNLRENMDADTICRYEGLEPNQASSIAIIQGLSGQGKNTEYAKMINQLKNGDPARKKEDREYLEQNVDIDSYLNWLALKVFFGDPDAGSTFVAYKTSGQKWKCAAIWFDYGLFNSAYNAAESYLDPAGFGQQNYDNTVFLKILEISEYREVFLQKLGGLYQVLTTETMQEELDACVTAIEPEMVRHFERWASLNEPAINPEAPTTAEEAILYWKQRIDRMRSGTMVKRPGYVYLQIQEYFNLSNQEMIRYFGGANNEVDSAADDREYEYIILEDGSAEISKYLGEENEAVIIPETIDGNRVTKIGFKAFSECHSVKYLRIPEGVTCIGSKAFSNCTSLADIYLPNTLTVIGENAFEYCTSLTGIQITENVETIGNGAFSYCASLDSVDLPYKITELSNDLFHQCRSLKEIWIPESVVSIGENTFAFCESLTEIKLPDGLKTIGHYAFGGCFALETLTIPAEVEYIARYAFLDCNRLSFIVTRDSYAEEYCNENRKTYHALP